MEATTLLNLYGSLYTGPAVVYIAPKINDDFPDSDYLYNFYRPFNEQQSDYRLKSLSVFTHFVPFFMRLAGKKVIFHYHWLEFQDAKSLAGMPWKLLWIFLFRLIGGKLVWTLHNSEPHDNKYVNLHAFLHKKMARYAHVLHVHCNYAAEFMSQKLQVPLERFVVIPHPYFPAKTFPKDEAVHWLNRQYKLSLNPEKPVALIFGQISYYKNIEGILADFTSEDSGGIQFFVAGTVKKGNTDVYEILREQAAQNPNIKIVADFISDTELPYFMNSADVVVFNYRKILTSGGIFMALSYDKKVIAPDLGCLTEFRSHPKVQLFKTDSERVGLLKSMAET